MEKTTDATSPIKWPGFFEVTNRRCLGFEYASGKYLTAFTCVGKNTEYIAPFKPVAPGTMLRTTTDFKLLVVPFWFVMLSTAILPAIRICRGMRRLSGRIAHSVA